MNRAQFVRMTRGGQGPPAPPPGVVTEPSIVSAEVRVGVGQNVEPGTYNNVTGAPTYVWAVDGVPVATGTSYTPVTDDVDGMLTVTETVSGPGGILSRTSAAVGPILAASGGSAEIPPGLENALAGVDTDTLIRRNAKMAEYDDNTWGGVPDDAVFYTDLVATSSADLSAKLDALDRSNLSRFHRIRLSGPGPWGAVSLRGADGGDVEAAHPGGVWNGSLYYIPGGIWDTGHRYGSPLDRSSAGGGVLIESQSTQIMFTGTVTVRGYRGLHFKNVAFSKEAAGETNADRDATTMLVITTSTTNRDAPVVVVEDCDIGTFVNSANTNPLKCGIGISSTGGIEQVEVRNCRFNGCQTGMGSSAIRYLKLEGNDFQNILGDCMINTHTQLMTSINSSWDERVLHIRRMNTNRNMVDNAKLSHEHTDFGQSGTGADVGGYSILSEFECSYGERLTFTDCKFITYSAIPADGATITIGGVVFTYRTAVSATTDILIGATLTATMSNAKAVILAGGVPHLDRIIVESGVMKLHFEAYNVQTVVAPGASIQTARLAGGTQFLYHDDLGAAYTMDAVAVCCLGTANDGINFRVYNGSAVVDRCTFGRPGAQPPDAGATYGDPFSASYDYEAYGTSGRKASTVAVDHKVRNTVIGQIVDMPGGVVTRTDDGVYTTANSRLEMVGNRYVRWQKGGPSDRKPGALMAGTFGTDAQGRVSYSFTDDGSASQAAFRAQLYAQLKLANVTDRANIGCTDPAHWA